MTMDHYADLKKRRMERHIWEEVREEKGTVEMLKMFLYRYTNDADVAISTVKSIISIKSERWLNTRDIGNLLDYMDTCVEMINGNPMYQTE